jgi:hypothetical protein
MAASGLVGEAGFWWLKILTWCAERFSVVGCTLCSGAREPGLFGIIGANAETHS